MKYIGGSTDLVAFIDIYKMSPARREEWQKAMDDCLHNLLVSIRRRGQDARQKARPKRARRARREVG